MLMSAVGRPSEIDSDHGRLSIGVLNSVVELRSWYINIRRRISAALAPSPIVCEASVADRDSDISRRYRQMSSEIAQASRSGQSSQSARFNIGMILVIKKHFKLVGLAIVHSTSICTHVALCRLGPAPCRIATPAAARHRHSSGLARRLG